MGVDLVYYANPHHLEHDFIVAPGADPSVIALRFEGIEQMLCRIRAEFEEMPCLRLARRQAQRLFGLRADVCDRVLAVLVGEGTLTCGPDERYGVRGLGWPTTVPDYASWGETTVPRACVF